MLSLLSLNLMVLGRICSGGEHLSGHPQSAPSYVAPAAERRKKAVRLMLGWQANVMSLVASGIWSA